MVGRMLGGSSEASVTRRLAGIIFIIRVFSAGLAYLSQILLARWMGGSDYGVYVYVWTWVLLLGSILAFRRPRKRSFRNTARAANTRYCAAFSRAAAG